MIHLFGSHFGTYEVQGIEGQQKLLPFRHDLEPSAVGAAFLDLAEHSQRVTQPMVRAGWLAGHDTEAFAGELRGRDTFVPVSWETAVALVAGEIDRVRTRHGNASIFGGSYGWASAGRFHHAQSQLKRFLNLAGGFTASVNSYSYGTARVMLPHVIGAEHREAGAMAPSWDQIALHTDHLVAFGGFRMTNAQVEAGGTGSHRAGDWLARALARGMRMTVLSPVRGDAPAGPNVAHIWIRPNTDTAVLLAMCHTLLVGGMVDDEFVARCTTGFAPFAAYLRGETDGVAKTPAWASALSGVSVEDIERLARSVRWDRTLVNLTWSLQRARFGEQPYWAAIALCALAGSVGKPGAGFAFGLTAVQSIGQPLRKLQGSSMPQGENRVRSFIPVAAINELLERPGGQLDYDGTRIDLPDIRLVYWAGGNPFHHHQDLNRLARAFQRPETVIVHESMWTATALHADIVLPVSLAFERDDLAASSRDNWLVASRAVSPPPAMVLSDHAILARVAEHLGFAGDFTEGMDEGQWIARLYDGYRQRHNELPDFAMFWETGFACLDPDDEAPRPVVPFAAFVADPAGQPLSTPSGRIELFSERVRAFGYGDAPGHAAWLAPEEWLGADLAQVFPFHLLSPQPAHRLHSQLDLAGPSQASKIAGCEPVLMNRDDAAARGIAEGDLVELFNDRGVCLAAAMPSSDVMAGVLVLATGAWFRPQAGRDAGGNPNTLTGDRRASRLSQGAAPNSTLVDIRRLS